MLHPPERCLVCDASLSEFPARHELECPYYTMTVEAQQHRLDRAKRRA